MFFLYWKFEHCGEDHSPYSQAHNPVLPEHRTWLHIPESHELGVNKGLHSSQGSCDHPFQLWPI